MADSDTTQQVTSQTPAKKQKNPKRVAAGKASAERTRLLREEVTSQTPATKQKNPKRVAAGKASAERTRLLREAQSISAKNQPTVEPPPPALR